MTAMPILNLSQADPRTSWLPVVLLTGQAEPGDTAAGFEAGITDYMTKPFKPAHVVARVHTWLLRARRSEG